MKLQVEPHRTKRTPEKRAESSLVNFRQSRSSKSQQGLKRHVAHPGENLKGALCVCLANQANSGVFSPKDRVDHAEVAGT